MIRNINKLILILLGIAILSLILVTNKSQATDQVKVTAKVDPTLTLSLAKIKDSEGYKLTISSNCSGYIVNLSEGDSIIVQEKDTTILDIHTLTENFIYARL